jgi:hypothetical protein
VSFNTSVIICGCSAKASPVGIVPPLDTPVECLASGPTESDTSSDIAYNFEEFNVTCNTDVRGNPNQDCLNAMVALCSPNSLAKNPYKCGELIHKLAAKSKESTILYWSDYFQDCFIKPNQIKCNLAAKSLRDNAYLSDINQSYEWNSQELFTGYITQEITDGIEQLILSNLINA